MNGVVTKLDELANNTISRLNNSEGRIEKLEKQNAEWSETTKQRTLTLADFEMRIRKVETAAIENKTIDRLITAGVSIVSSALVAALLSHFHF